MMTDFRGTGSAPSDYVPMNHYIPFADLHEALRIDAARLRVLMGLTAPTLPRIRSRTGQRAGAGFMALEAESAIEWLEHIWYGWNSDLLAKLRAAAVTSDEFNRRCREQTEPAFAAV